MRNLIKKLYNIGLPLLLAGCVSGTTPVAYQPTHITEREETAVVEVMLTSTYVPLTTSTPAHALTNIPTEVPTMQPSPQVSDKRLEDFMNKYGTDMLTNYVIVPRQTKEIIRWSEEIMHLDDPMSYYSCMLIPDSGTNRDWEETRNCVKTIDSLTDELKEKVIEVGGDNTYNAGVFEKLDGQLSKLSQLAEYEDTAKYDYEMLETRRILGQLYVNVIQVLPEVLLPQPSTQFYMFTDNQQISPDTVVPKPYNMYNDSAKTFGTFFVDEHNYAKRIFVFGNSIIDLIGIFEYENPADAENALNRLHNSVKFAEQTFTIDGNEYQMIYWKVLEYNTNQYALFANRGRFLIIADPDTHIKSDDNQLVEDLLTPLLE